MAKRKSADSRQPKKHSPSLRKKHDSPKRGKVGPRARNVQPAQHDTIPRPAKNRKPGAQGIRGSGQGRAVAATAKPKGKAKPKKASKKTLRDARRGKERASAAAKKGWAKRRKKEREAYKAEIAKREKIHRELLKRQRRTAKQIRADAKREVEYAKKHGERVEEELKEDIERVAIQQESLKQQTRAAIEETIILRITKQVMERMFQAEQEGHLDDMSFELADEFGYDRSEIYSMYHGYTPNYLPTTIPFAV